MNSLFKRFGDSPPSDADLYRAVREWADDACVSRYSILNFLLSNGDVMVAGSWPGARPGSTCWNGLHYVVREAPFATAHLSDIDFQVDFAKETTSSDRVAVIATYPLTDNERWREFESRELLLFRDGRPFVPREDGRGLRARDYKHRGGGYDGKRAPQFVDSGDMMI